MQKIKIENKEINYIIKKNNRAKRLRITVHSDASVIVTIPNRLTEVFVKRFLKEKSKWLLEKIEYFEKNKNPLLRHSREDYLKNKEKAYQIAEKKVIFFNKIYNYVYNKLTIRNQKTRWGSCSKKGNLNFNYKIIYLPENQIDYIVVHELCHLKEFNHSKKFWELVAKTLPNYREVKKDLKRAIIDT